MSERFPLSPQQRRLWAASGRSVGSPFDARCRVRITGPLEVAALLPVLGQLSDRHEVLRTTVANETAAEPVQVIGEQHVGPEYLEGRSTGVDTRTELERLSALAIALVRLAPEEHLLCFHFPSLCTDRTGLESLVNDVCEGYDAATRDASRENASLRYVDAAAWLNEAVSSADAEPGRAFWRTHAGLESVPRLPFDRLQGHAPFAPATHVVGPIPEHAPEPLAAEWLVLACWRHLLERLADADALSIAFAHDGRQYAELEGAVGLYERTLPLRARRADAVNAARAADDAAMAVADALQWADAFEWPLLARTPDADVVAPYVFELRRPQPPRHAGGVTVDVEECEAFADRFALKLVCALDGGTGALTLHYDTARYRDDDIRELGHSLLILLRHAAAAPDTPLGAFPLVEPAEWATQVLVPSPMLDVVDCVHHSFQARAREAPDAIAVTCEDRQLTFAALNLRANRLAHRLRRHGVGPNVPVGLCLERSVDLMVGLLGILKAGGGYVALDPQLPAHRLALMIDAAGARFVVTDRATHDSKVVGRAVLLDDEHDPLDAEPGEDPPNLAGLEHLAYVLFTSGSTGLPKGVAVEHGNLARYVAAVRERLELPATASYATVTTVASDLGNTAIFPALTGGGHLHVVAEDRAADAERFAEYAARHGIDVLKIVPSHLRALLSASSPERVLPTSRLVLGGEACPWDLVELVRRLKPGCRVFNHYGPTETTVGVTTFEVTADRGPLDGPTVPIGWALHHARAYVLDETRRPVPRWFIGDLHIGGPCVTRGYVNAEPGADSPFLPDPSAREHGHRIYRTGDRVRVRAHGEIEFLGRADDQVKIRGFRIEPGEIAAVLRQHPAVENAAVLVSRSDAGQPRLVAAVASHDGALTERDLKTYLAGRLLEAMVPASVVVLRALPLTSNGKLDRAAVESLVRSAPARPSHALAPAGEWEEALADIWRELLEIEQVSPTDNFYDLGGHSLLAIQAVTTLEKRRGVRLVARDLVFQTLRQVAALCESKIAARA